MGTPEQTTVFLGKMFTKIAMNCSNKSEPEISEEVNANIDKIFNLS